MTPDDLGITKDQYSNLEKLADLLETVEEDKFDMRDFATLDGYGGFCPNYIHKVGECGTIACAAGHLVKIIEPLEGETWDDFIDRETGLECGSDIWSWLFDGGWVGTDNTALGASKRIRYFLKNDTPNDWLGQMLGDAPLCY